MLAFVLCCHFSVHPHVRGDYPSKRLFAPWRSGSPPRAWGLLSDSLDFSRRIRFTPTCVGTTVRRFRLPLRTPVHPHVRGDYLYAVFAALRHGGSPPRAWGLHTDVDASQIVQRFTPTCVGTTYGDSDSHEKRPVHPHVRGDYSNYFNPPPFIVGSPPRAWGLPHQERLPEQAWRFTPTCVGTTCGYSPSQLGWSVHPHVRGDYTNQASAETGDAGSPPRAWGLRAADCARRQAFRFTPTCVGTTSCCSIASSALTVHPHVRGDYT